MVTAANGNVNHLSICGQSAPVDAWKRALERAHAEGVRVHRDARGWYTSSASHPDKAHRVNGRCDCQAAMHSRVCKHLAAVRSAQALRGELARCEHCGRVDYTSQMFYESRHVGGQPDRHCYYCGCAERRLAAGREQ